MLPRLVLAYEHCSRYSECRLQADVSRALLSVLVIALTLTDNDDVTVTDARGVRARVRHELTSEIIDAARRQLGEVGPAALSLRAVARDVGMVSSAVYRYFPSRDDLLTALIIEAYDDLGAAVEQAEAKVRRSDLTGRWRTICRAVRTWALAHPHEYALLYGTPVPGYVAPQRTIPAASRVPTLLIALLRDVSAQRRPEDGQRHAPPVPRRARAAFASARAAMGPDIPDDLIVRGISAWSWLFGAVSLELFGHRIGSVDDDTAFFDLEIERMAEFVGLSR
jgi:AcrR family transcriptional regulator